MKMLQFEREQTTKTFQYAGSFSADSVQIGTVTSCSGNTVIAEGFHYPIGTGGMIAAEDGELVIAEVSAVDQTKTILTMLGSKPNIPIGSSVEPVENFNQVAVGCALMGRIIDPLGVPLDQLGPIRCDSRWPLYGKFTNPLRKGPVQTPIDVGVRSINALLPMGCGQRMALIAGSGVGKSVLLKQLVSNTDADVIVVGLIGERGREIGDFAAAVQSKGNGDKTIIVAVPADHAPLLRIKAAQSATAIAEYFRNQGKSVLLVVDSLTRVAHAQREIGLSLGEPPTMKGYPPSAAALIPAIVERGGNDTQTGGSITAIYSVLADGDDENDPIVDATRAITDGHIFLDRSLAEQGVFPAINVSKSISRVANDLVPDDHRTAIAEFRALMNCHEENRDLVLMGAYQSGSNPMLDKALVCHNDQLKFLSQPEDDVQNMDASVTALIEGFGA